MNEVSVRKIIRALYIIGTKGHSFKTLISDQAFVFSDTKTSLDFLEFLNTYLVGNGK